MFNLLQPTALSIFVTDSETLTMMWQTVVLGMAMVFSVLATLWLILSLFKVIFAGKDPKEKKEKAPAPVVEAPVAEPVGNIVSAENTNDNDGELLAVITAAVAAYIAEENGGEAPVGGFRVVSFKRTGARAWNAK